MTEPGDTNEERSGVRLDRFSAAGFDRGASRFKEALWVGIGSPLLSSFMPGSRWRVRLLRAFGARIGIGTVWKPHVRVKFPWRLAVGDHCWVGEDVWIDNLARVELSNHVCLSQGAYLCTGNHDWSVETFDLITREIVIRDGSWVGAKAVIAPGTRINEAAVVTAGSVGSGDLEASKIYRGNPARPVGFRKMGKSYTAFADNRSHAFQPAPAGE